ncbi:MAG: hypothetical protein D6702_10650 [Planctomycetota bacterium]|nr:MAG: hypothetical protein D6702_10650 [Planctomycetota bacterium]
MFLLSLLTPLLVEAGTYVENLDDLGEALTVVSRSGPELTTIRPPAGGTWSWVSRLEDLEDGWGRPGTPTRPATTWSSSPGP